MKLQQADLSPAEGYENREHIRAYTIDEADAYCNRLARNHYENFTVASALLPRHLEPHFFCVYAFCRWADDLGDELGNPAKSLEALRWWKGELDACYAGHPQHPVFVSLWRTARQFDIPRDLFDDLIDAFVQDQSLTRYDTYERLLDYCKRSANPVGRLVLYLCGYSDEERQKFSDFTCTALQLTNFWQDVTRDIQKDRVYIPQEDLDHFGCTVDQILERRCTPAFQQLMQFEVQRTRSLFERGLPLIPTLSGPIRLDIQLFSQGGLKILDKIASQKFNVLERRPALSRTEKILLTGQWLLRRLLHLP